MLYLTDALTAAVDGDTIRIVDSATYAESLTIDKTVTIVAEAGETPTIEATGAFAIVFTGVDKDLQVGSSSGGRITLRGPDGLAQDPVVFSQGVVQSYTGSGSISFTNVTMRAEDSYPGLEVRAPNLDVSLNDVEIDGMGDGIHGLFLRLSATSTSPPTYRIENTHMHNFREAHQAIFIRDYRDEANLEIISSIIDSGDNAVSTRQTVADMENAKFNITIADSVLRSNSSNVAASPVYLRASEFDLTATRSVFENVNQGYAFRVSSEAYVTAGSVFAFDHCDFIGGSADALELLGSTAGVTIENSIILAATGQTGIVGNASSALTSRHNGISADTLYADWDSETIENDLDFTPGAPAYVDAAASDYRYDEPEALLTASDEGTSVGSQYDFVNQVAGPPDQTDVQDWNLFQ